jgi:hypothetical protein
MAIAKNGEKDREMGSVAPSRSHDKILHFARQRHHDSLAQEYDF